jgi:hypothetical protein
MPSAALSCLCGARLRVPRGSDARHACPSCRRKFELVDEPGSDPFPVYVDEWTDPEATAAPDDVGPGEADAMVFCVCGQVLSVRRDKFGRKVRCPACGFRMRLTVLLDAAGGARIEPVPLGAAPDGPAGPIEVSCVCGGFLHLDLAVRRSAMCDCGRRISLFVREDGEPVPVFSDIRR